MNVYDYYITPEEYEIARKNGISEQALNFRIRDLGWNKKRAITQPVAPHVDRKKWAAVARENGIKQSTFRSRISKYGMTPKEAATKPLQCMVMTREKAHKKVRKYPKEIMELAEKNGIKKNTFYHRVNVLKMSPRNAATMPVMTHEEVSKIGTLAMRELIKGR